MDADVVVTRLLDLARSALGTPLAVLARTGGTAPDVRCTSSGLDGAQVRDLLRELPAALGPGPGGGPPWVEVLNPDGTAYGRLVGLGPSVGAAPAAREDLRTLAALLTDALHGRDRRAGERQRRAGALDAALRGSGRTTALQHIVDLRTGRVVGAEALTRFRSAAGEVLAPEQVFAQAHRAGLGVLLEHATLDAALRLLPRLPAGRYLSVNASPAALLSPHTTSALLAHAPHRLVVEITEHDPVTDYRALGEVTARLRRHGVRIAVDDVGSGFASLRHVLRLAPDVLKLDIAFVAGIDTDPARRAAARALVGFAREVGATLVAEGVERPAELSALRRLGVPLGQGFLLHRPSAVRTGWDGDGREGDGNGPAPLDGEPGRERRVGAAVQVRT